MARSITNLLGQTFGYLTVIRRADNDSGGRAQWACLCVCGKEKIIRRSNLQSGTTQSCGCKRSAFRLARQTQCKRGHQFDEANTQYVRSGKSRRCRACAKLWRQNNPEKVRAVVDEWNKQHPEYKKKLEREWRLKNEYGLSWNEYTALLEKHNFVCAICGKDNNGKCLCVDHDHETGKVRGLLCKFCNWSIGMLDESPDTLRKAAAYLESHQ